MSILDVNQKPIVLTYVAACYLGCLSCWSVWLDVVVLSWAPAKFHDGSRAPVEDLKDTHNPENEILTAKSSSSGLPQRPRRYFIPLLVGLVVLRLEVFLGTEHQCALPGFEAFLPLVVIYRQLRLSQPQSSKDESNPGLGQSLRWISILGSILISVGVWLAALPTSQSTFFCSPGASKLWTIVLQIVGLASEATVIEIIWRVLSRQRTSKQLIITVAGVLLQAALGTLIALVFHYGVDSFSTGMGTMYQRPVSSWIPYSLDILLFGCLLAVFTLSSGSLISQVGPAFLVHILAIICGLIAVVINTAAIGTWYGLTTSSVILSMLPLVIGAVLFIHSARAVSPLVSACLVLVLFCFLIGTSIWAIVKRGHPTRMHPLQTMISDMRVEADRWLVHASTSDSLRVAVTEYRQRHDGREPPKGFDLWYAYAIEHKSPIIDFFDQIHRDLQPFWGLEPSQIRKGVEKLEHERDIVVIKVINGQVTHGAARSEHLDEINGLVEMMQSFSKHLPDLQIAVNLDINPRVLAPWGNIDKRVLPGTRGRFSRRDNMQEVESLGASGKGSLQPNAPGETSEGQDVMASSPSGPTISAAEFRRLNMQACPRRSPVRSKLYWNTRDICVSCFNQESSGAFLKDWTLSSDLCHQPDIFKLHSLFISGPVSDPLTDLQPVFSRSKPSTFSDILIPWPRTPGNQNKVLDSGLDFQTKRDQPFWRGKIEQITLPNQRHHGGHQQRLVHLVNNASMSDEVIIAMATEWKDSEGKRLFQYEPVKTLKMNQVLLPDVRIGEYASCNAPERINTRSCRSMIEEFGPAVEADAPIFDNRFVLLTDSDTTAASNTGPGSDFVMDALESSSLPFIGTIFREWYSERLRPWLHFVPVDLRYTALHSTWAYFMGLDGRGKIKGRDPGVEAHLDNAVWIADQGKKWAERAMRPTDAQIYLFRLLLEWGRIISDDRDGMNYFLENTA
ncbi:hypothetical protein PpBr36_08397 [Pyricularia pennisetigena]|uniref:hypothetical protein n=1 Tax=Pyricularia pennisetigena TaxID=1578925 RepID=UPI00114F31D0|nr:hypothetical protein PpBr36_08397 [Pyricularia pennisetigena]TLS24028.1 hypothetical protein PpBr36_08397 [Pyricularia pennisetigena]